MWDDVEMEGDQNVIEDESLYQLIEQPTKLRKRATLEDSVNFFKEKLEQLMGIEAKLRSKVEYLHTLEHQLSLVLNQKLESRYGTTNQDSSGSRMKTVVPPLPPVDKPRHGEFLRILHNLSPSDIKKYMNRSGSVDSLVFGDSSVFDDPLLNSVMRTPPDSQIAFLEGAVAEVQRCGEFYQKMLPLLSYFSMNSELRGQLTSPSAVNDVFWQFYQKAGDILADLGNAKTCKLAFAVKEGREILFPTEKFTYIIDTNDSLIGQVMKSVKIRRVESPTEEAAYEVITECGLFDTNDPVIMAPFGVKHRSALGVLVMSRERRFDENDEIIVSAITNYLTPVLNLFREVFVDVTPQHFRQLTTSIAKMRQSTSLFTSLSEELCKMTSASICKYYCVSAESDYKDVPVLPDGPSLIRRSYNVMTAFAYRNPRSRDDFNKDVDDECSISKLTSMLVVPVKGTHLVTVLYNTTTATTFTQIQISLSTLLTSTLSPLLYQCSMRKQMEKMKTIQEQKTKVLERIRNTLEPLMIAVNGEKFCDAIIRLLDPGLKCHLFYFLGDKECFRLPEHELVLATNLLESVQETTVIESEIVHEIECSGDKDVKSLLIIPSFGDAKVLCVFSSHENDVFDTDNDSFLVRFARNILLLVPSYLTRYQLREIKKRHEKLQKVEAMDLDMLSAFVGTEIECHYFDPPLTEEPNLPVSLTVSIETPRGIEAALTTSKAISNEVAKDAIVAFAEWMSASLAARMPQKEPSPVLVSFFLDSGLPDLLTCTIFNLTDWLGKTTTLFEENKIVMDGRLTSMKFVAKILEAKRWEGWFTKEEKIILCLMAYLHGIEKIWRCRADEVLIKESIGCRDVSGPYIASIFGKGYGLTDALGSETRRTLISIVDEYAIADNASCQAAIIAHIRLMAMQGFKQTAETKRWLGRAILMLIPVCELAEAPEKSIESMRERMSDEEHKSFIFMIERLYVPALTFLAQRNEVIMEILNNIKIGMKVLHAQGKTC